MNSKLAGTEGSEKSFSNILKNQKKLYLDEEFSMLMISLYSFFVKPSIKLYDTDKIEASLQRGRINDALRRSRNSEENNLEEGIA